MQVLLVRGEPVGGDELVVVQRFQEGYLELAIDSVGEELFVVRHEELKPRGPGEAGIGRAAAFHPGRISGEIKGEPWHTAASDPFARQNAP